VNRFFRALKSVRLAIILIAFLALTSLLASLVPQGREGEYYYANYPNLLAWIMLRSGFSNFFRSILFAAASGLFFVNLSFCAIDRFIRERRKSIRRHGPDLLHLGIMLLFLGGLLSFTGRQSGYVWLARGDAVRLPGDRLLQLTDFAYLKYLDGRPKDWISTVRLSAGEKTLLDSFPIRVNHPLKLGLLSIYQVSHEIERALLLRDTGGGTHSLARGEETRAGALSIYLVDPGKEGEKALIRVQDAAGPRMVSVAPGDRIGSMSVADIRDIEFSGLEAVRDPGFPLVLISLILVGVGAFFTLYQRLHDMGESRT